MRTTEPDGPPPRPPLLITEAAERLKAALARTVNVDVIGDEVIFTTGDPDEAA